MPTKRFDWHGRIKEVELQHNATRFVLDYSLSEVVPGRLSLPLGMRVRHLRDACEAIEGTYIVRLFAEFETCLRSYWVAERGTDPPSRTRDLVDSIRAKRNVPQDQADHVHEVREYRNALVHERDDQPTPIPLPTARSHLSRFIQYLPDGW